MVIFVGEALSRYGLSAVHDVFVTQRRILDCICFFFIFIYYIYLKPDK